MSTGVYWETTYQGDQRQRPMDGEEIGQPLKTSALIWNFNVQAGLFVCFRSLSLLDQRFMHQDCRLTIHYLSPLHNAERKPKLLQLLAWKNDRSRDLGGGLYSARKDAPAKKARMPYGVWPLDTNSTLKHWCWSTTAMRLNKIGNKITISMTQSTNMLYFFYAFTS